MDYNNNHHQISDHQIIINKRKKVNEIFQYSYNEFRNQINNHSYDCLFVHLLFV